FELTGFTDTSGSAAYNLQLSRRRAESVARYLVRQNVPLKNISMIGMGEEQTPELLAAEVQAVDPNATNKDLRSPARRVRVRMYTPNSASTPSAKSAGGSVTAAEQ